MKKILKKIFFQGDTWKIAWRKTDSNIFNDKETPFEIVKMPRGFWGADPFLVEIDHSVFVVFELTNFKKRKSLIASKDLLQTDSKINVMYEFPYHSSFPCIFEHNNNIYIIPETVQNKDVALLKCVNWPLNWHLEKFLLTNTSLVDSVFRKSENKMYLLTYSNESFKTSLLSLDENLNVKNCLEEKEIKENLLRPAGKFIEIESGTYIRPVQPSTKFYGEKVSFYKGQELSNEREVFSFSINDIKLTEKKKKKYIGVHTYNKLGNVEIIDIAEMSFRPFKVIEFIFRKLNLFGYGLYDKKQKLIKQKLDSKYFSVFNK